MPKVTATEAGVIPYMFPTPPWLQRTMWTTPKRKGGLRGKAEKTWYKWHIFENLGLNSFHLWTIKMVNISKDNE